MVDELDALDTEALRKECLKLGIMFPCGNPLLLSSKWECLNALRNPAYLEAAKLGLLKED